MKKINPTKRKTIEEWINNAIEVHGSKYDYSKVEYVNGKTKVCIICPEHGEFWQNARNHVNGEGCPLCARFKKRKPHKQHKPRRSNLITLNQFSDLVKNKFGDLIEIVKYNGFKEKAILKCKATDNGIEHGIFEVTPNDFIKESRKTACPKCLIEYRRKLYKSSTEEFIEKARKVHGNRYDYSKVEYKNNTTKICIICPEHGEFYQTPQNHLAKRGCPICKQEKNTYEKNIYKILLEHFNENDILREYKNEKMLGKLTLDFYIPKYKIAIEHQGSQHFKITPYFQDVTKFKKLQKNDKIKYKILKENGIRLLYFSYEKYTVPENYIDKVYTNIHEFIEIIKNIKNKQL